MTDDRARIGRNNRLRSRVYEREWAEFLRQFWPNAERVERSGAGRYVKGDIRNTPPLHWSIRSGVSINWRKAHADAAQEVAEREELGDLLPIAGLTDRSCTRLKHYVLMERGDLIKFAKWLLNVGGGHWD